MAGSGTGIAPGALIDGIPESMAIGLTMLSGLAALAGYTVFGDFSAETQAATMTRREPDQPASGGASPVSSSPRCSR